MRNERASNWLKENMEVVVFDLELDNKIMTFRKLTRKEFKTMRHKQALCQVQNGNMIDLEEGILSELCISHTRREFDDLMNSEDTDLSFSLRLWNKYSIELSNSFNHHLTTEIPDNSNPTTTTTTTTTGFWCLGGRYQFKKPQRSVYKSFMNSELLLPVSETNNRLENYDTLLFSCIVSHTKDELERDFQENYRLPELLAGEFIGLLHVNQSEFKKKQ